MGKAMKRVYLSLVFLVLAGTLYAADVLNRNVFIEGSAETDNQRIFFLNNFKTEAEASGYTVPFFKYEAGYTFNFRVVPNVIVYEDGTQEPAPPDEKQFSIIITFTRNADSTELVNFDFPFSELDEMYEYNQYLFLKAAVFIPPVTETNTPGKSGTAVNMQENSIWKDKWLYFRLSLDYPIMFYIVKTSDLSLDNIIYPQPGLTAGVELQFLDWMSLEPFFQLSFGDPVNYGFFDNLKERNFNMAAGANLKFPIKFSSLVVAPYGAFLYPLNKASVFEEFPRFAFGGGVQFGVRGVKDGSFFADVSYLHCLDEAVIKDVHPGTGNVRYQRYTVGFSIGYKIGIVDRKSSSP